MNSRTIDACVFSAAAILLAAVLPGAAQAQVVAKGSCTTNATKYIVSKTEQVTASTSFVNVGGTKVAFKQGGSEAGCVTVLFSSGSTLDPGEKLHIQAVLNGGIICEPGNNIFTASTVVGDKSMNFVCPDVSPGNHSIQMQFRSDAAGNVYLQTRTTIVNYAQ